VLANFLIDWVEIQYEPPKPDSNYWRMHFDGSKTIHGLGAGIVLTYEHPNFVATYKRPTSKNNLQAVP
jgi:hypothetical protein